MTNEELKTAMFYCKPVIYTDASTGDKIRARCVSAIRYAYDRKKNLVVQAEIIEERNGRTLMLVSPKQLELAPITVREEEI